MVLLQVQRGSVIVIVEIADSESVNSANLTILLSQLEQDVSSISYHNAFITTPLLYLTAL